MWLTLERAMQGEGGAGLAFERTPLSGPWLAVDAIDRLHESNPGSAELWVASGFGARDAVLFANAVHRASEAFPLRERESRVKHVRCAGCGLRTLKWSPPEFYLDEVRVECVNCGRLYDQRQMALIAEMEEANA